MSEMELNEIKSRFDESMKRAVSRANELATIMKQPLYNQWAKALDRMRVQGMYMSNAKSRSKMQIESDVTMYQDKMNMKQESF